MHRTMFVAGGGVQFELSYANEAVVPGAMLRRRERLC